MVVESAHICGRVGFVLGVTSYLGHLLVKCKAKNEMDTLVYIVQREAPKRKLVKKRDRERELITKEVS